MSILDIFSKKNKLHQGQVSIQNYSGELDIIPITLLLAESIDQPFAKGYIEYTDTSNEFESKPLFTPHPGAYMDMVMKGAVGDKEHEHRRFYKMAAYNTSSKITDMYSNVVNRLVSKTLIQEPIYSNLYNKKINKVYKNQNVYDIVRDIITNGDYGLAFANENTRIQFDEYDQFMPTCVIPFWSPYKALLYLSNYIKGGPFKFWVSNEFDKATNTPKYIFNVAPLSKLMTNIDKTFIIKPNIANDQIYFMEPEFEIYGPDEASAYNHIGGETVYQFDYMYGMKGNTVDTANVEIRKDFNIPGLLYDSYNRERAYVSEFSGTYKYGSTLVGNELSILNENYKLIQGEDYHNTARNFSLDVDTKPLVANKILNRFRNAYSRQLILKGMMPPSKNLVVGTSYRIEIPIYSNVNPGVPSGLNPMYTGYWLLNKIIHKMVPVDGVKVYKMECYFTKSTLNAS
jgi:hypothetical protein